MLAIIMEKLACQRFSHCKAHTILILLCLLVNYSHQQNFASPPQNVSVSSETGKPGEQTDKLQAFIEVTWSRPARIDGSLTGYSILYGRTDGTGSNKTIKVGSSFSTIKIHKQITYRNFTIFVRAKTDKGYGEWSDPYIILSAEGVPTEGCEYVKAFSPSPTTIYLEWQPLRPEVQHGVLLGYKVLYLKRGEIVANYKEVNLPIGTHNYTITGLEPYATYFAGTIGYTIKGFYLYQGIIDKARSLTTMEDVPSRPPSDVTPKMLCKEYALSIEWNPLQTQYRNGKLLGYQVMVNQDKTFYKNLTVNKEKVTIPLDECKNYSVQVAGMTSPGVGKYSDGVDVITSCTCGPPQPLYSNRIIVAKEGEPLQLVCEYYCRPAASVQWLRYGKPVNVTGQSGFISIDNVTNSDGGGYKCLINNSFGAATANLFVVVTRDVVSLNFKMNVVGLENQVDKRQSKWFKDNIISKIESTVQRYFKELNNTYQITTTDFSSLSTNATNVQMTITQAIGNAKSAEQTREKLKEIIIKKMGKGTVLSTTVKIESLTFKEAPPRPLDPKATHKTSKSIKISWTEPEHKDFYNISGYSIRYSKDSKEWVNDSQSISWDRNEATVEHLQADKEYSFIVAAQNEYGETSSKSISAKTTANLAMVITLAVVLPLLLIPVLVGFFIWWTRQRRRRKEIENQLIVEHEERIRLEKEQSNLISFEDLLEMQNKNFEICWKEITRENVELLGVLGSGAFGEVKKAKLTLDDGQSQFCAVKMLKSQATKEELSDLANELNIMATVGEHPNIASLIGACSVAGPLWVVVKLAENGSLIGYLQSIRYASANYENVTTENSKPACLSYDEKLALAYGIASGMKHLADHKCVHRDLAARNVLLGENNQPMVSDFGLSRDIYESGQYEKTTSGKLPVKWMAIESLENMIFTLESDVWSYGIVLWEIETLGEIPYPGLNGKEILDRLHQGIRLEKPKDCSSSMYEIMNECWIEQPKQRPKFGDLIQEISTLMNEEKEQCQEKNDMDKEDVDNKDKYLETKL